TAFVHRPDVHLYASGTAALAAALHSVARVGEGIDRVVIPAYGCPALVAAALHAGLEPELIDLAPGSAFPSRSALEEFVPGTRVVFVHVNFLGLPPPDRSSDEPEG